jgi:hypothetical protein
MATSITPFPFRSGRSVYLGIEAQGTNILLRGQCYSSRVSPLVVAVVRSAWHDDKTLLARDVLRHVEEWQR